MRNIAQQIPTMLTIGLAIETWKIQLLSRSNNRTVVVIISINITTVHR